MQLLYMKVDSGTLHKIETELYGSCLKGIVEEKMVTNTLIPLPRVANGIGEMITS